MNKLSVVTKEGVKMVEEVKTVTTEVKTEYTKEAVLSQLQNVDNQLSDIVKLQDRKKMLEEILAKFT